MRLNWKTLAINKLQDSWGFNEAEAIAFYNKVYRKALAEVGGKQKNLKISREIYGSLFFRGEQVFQIDNAGTKVEMNPILNTTRDLETSLRLSRMKAFFDKYGDSKYLQGTINEYQKGNISKEEFNSQIKAFKKYSTKYLKADS